jgi:hypothetical protein
VPPLAHGLGAHRSPRKNTQRRSVNGQRLEGNSTGQLLTVFTGRPSVAVATAAGHLVVGQLDAQTAVLARAVGRLLYRERE